MRYPIPPAARRAIVDFDRLRGVLVEFRDVVFRAMPFAREEQREWTRLSLGDVLTRFDGAVGSAHVALARWHPGEIDDDALRIVADEPARIVEAAAADFWNELPP